jgi:hypothetical protein
MLRNTGNCLPRDMATFYRRLGTLKSEQIKFIILRDTGRDKMKKKYETKI